MTPEKSFEKGLSTVADRRASVADPTVWSVPLDKDGVPAGPAVPLEGVTGVDFSSTDGPRGTDGVVGPPVYDTRVTKVAPSTPAPMWSKTPTDEPPEERPVHPDHQVCVDALDWYDAVSCAMFAARHNHSSKCLSGRSVHSKDIVHPELVERDKDPGFSPFAPFEVVWTAANTYRYLPPAELHAKLMKACKTIKCQVCAALCAVIINTLQVEDLLETQGDIISSLLAGDQREDRAE